MKFVLTKVSCFDSEEVIEVSSIEELMRLTEKYGNPVIVYPHDATSPYKYPEIRVYDDYNE